MPYNLSRMLETGRLEVRLDKERKRRLHELAERRHASAAEVIRELIDRAYDEVDRERRYRAWERLCSLELPVPDDPEDLRREILSAHDIPDPYAPDSD